jgi:hypothetical protein
VEVPDKASESELRRDFDFSVKTRLCIAMERVGSLAEVKDADMQPL